MGAEHNAADTDRDIAAYPSPRMPPLIGVARAGIRTVDRAKAGMSTAAATRCIPAKTTFAAVVTALRGPANESSSTTRASTIQMGRTRAVTRSNTASSAHPASPASTLTSATATGPTS